MNDRKDSNFRLMLPQSRQLRFGYFFAVIVFCVSALHLFGCVAVPVAALANLAHKSGTMTVTLEGSQGIEKFRRAALAEGGTVPTITGSDYARAEFTDIDMRIEAQRIGSTIVVRGASLSNAGRTYSLEDSITTKTEAVTNRMLAQGMRLVSSERNRF